MHAVGGSMENSGTCTCGMMKLMETEGSHQIKVGRTHLFHGICVVHAYGYGYRRRLPLVDRRHG